MAKKKRAIKEMQIETTLRFHFTSVTMPTMKNRNNKYPKDARKRNPSQGCKLVQPLWKTI
jgi:hypothetical protein